ncbi:protein FANTASTIC FOUR 3-like [Oryza brachyantha]|uniref:protein FANTASTIC FOUR 3-like n=1 Tax=Oryza brachyantha TaxID=4533 RepID=UPI001AD966F8|nr:protein FANTASTIC FOUR 3-like [Oryza brachyantha]
MAADGGALRRLFEKPLPENPTLLEALSACNQVHHHHKKLVDTASFTEIFGELHFQEKPDRAFLPPPSRPPVRTLSWIDIADAAAAAETEKSKDDSSLDALLRPKAAAAAAATVKRSASFCLKSSESLLLCTEGLGSESTVDADDMVKDGDHDTAAAPARDQEVDVEGGDGADDAAVAAGRERRSAPASFPPPIRSIGRGGKPCVCFRSFRAEGRFVLMEVVIPGKELLQATREGGRLRLQFANAAAAVQGGVEADDRVEDDDEAAKNACAAIIVDDDTS